jgi:hypothetical protein
MLPTAPLPPTLTVRAPNRVTLSKPLLARIGHLRHGAPVELVPPLRRGGTWHLDTRPTAGRRLCARPGEAARFRSAHALGPEHFAQPALVARKGTKGGARGSAPPLRARTFELADAVPGHPGYYALRARPQAQAKPNGSAQQMPPPGG